LHSPFWVWYTALYLRNRVWTYNSISDCVFQLCVIFRIRITNSS
jgi:hypothetical protein